MRHFFTKCLRASWILPPRLQGVLSSGKRRHYFSSIFLKCLPFCPQISKIFLSSWILPPRLQGVLSSGKWRHTPGYRVLAARVCSNLTKLTNCQQPSPQNWIFPSQISTHCRLICALLLHRTFVFLVWSIFGIFVYLCLCISFFVFVKDSPPILAL